MLAIQKLWQAVLRPRQPVAGSFDALGGRFEAAPFELGSLGLPILKDALGGVECELVGELAHGDHTVFIGEVKSAVLHRDGDALELSTTGWQYGG